MMRGTAVEWCMVFDRRTFPVLRRRHLTAVWHADAVFISVSSSQLLKPTVSLQPMTWTADHAHLFHKLPLSSLFTIYGTFLVWGLIGLVTLTLDI